MNDNRRQSDIDHLLMELVDGTLMPDQQARLWALLRDDPSARARYADYLLLDSHLASECAWKAGEPGGNRTQQSIEERGPSTAGPRVAARNSKGAQSRIRGQRVRVTAAVAGILAGIMFLSFIAALWLRPVRAPIAIASAPSGHERWDEPGGETKAGGVAILTRAVDVVWEEGGPAYVVGSTLATGPLRIRAGVLQLEFYGGATVVMEGPGEIELKSIDRIACKSGKLRAHVPPSAQGFRVDSPAVDLVDLGTEFGMRVVPGQKSEVHVFSGKVELNKNTPSTAPAAKWEVSEGHGVRIGRSGEVTPLASDSPAFIAPPDLERLYLKESLVRYHEWAAGSRSLRGDRRLLVYYSFEDDRHLGSRILLNQSDERSMDGSIIGCEWVDGRWPGKGALEFKRPSDRVRIRVPGHFRSLTFTAWVRIDAIEHRFSGLLLTDGFELGEPHWQIDWMGRIVLGVRAEPERPSTGWFHNYDSPRVFTPERFGRWTHVATVYDDRTATVTHYVDGAEVGSVALKRRGSLRIGDAELGNWGVPVATDAWPVRNMCGRMDEFALFPAALAPSEVRVLYERGSP